LAAALLFLTLGFVTVLIHRSWESFASAYLPAKKPVLALPPPEPEVPDQTCSGSNKVEKCAAQSDAKISISDILRRGVIPNKTFFTLLAAQFAVAMTFVIWLNEFKYLSQDVRPGHQSIGAYLSEEKDPVKIALARILACDWSDRFKTSEIKAIVDALAHPPAQPAPATAATPNSISVDTARLDEFLKFAAALEKEFIGEAPSAIQNLITQLQPVYVILGALFLVTLRGLVQQADKARGFRMKSAAEGALLAFCLVLLAYFVILSYHSGTEVARAIAAGRIVCTDFVSPYFEAQARCLSLSAIILLSLFVSSPKPIFRNI
jgi:hypothetical protein